MINFQTKRSRRHNCLPNFLKLIGSQQINLYHWNIKFQEKIFTCKKVIQLWNFGNYGISEIIPKTLVTLRFLKVSLHELESNCKCFQMRYWPIFYIHPTHNSTHFSTCLVLITVMLVAPQIFKSNAVPVEL